MNNSPKIHTEIDDYLLYRRQFFFGPRYMENLNNWVKVPVGVNYLTIHPDLELTQAKNKQIELFLLGFILDANNPSFTNKDILNHLLNNSKNFDSFLDNTYSLGGRWIIIYIENNDIRFFNDACGSRQIFYTFQNTGVWCASQPHTIAQELDIEKNRNHEFLNFINSKEFINNENALFGDVTLYDDIFHLLPNHYLSISNKTTVRYWPKKTAPITDIDTVIKKVSSLLNGLYEAANNRYELIQPVTAGRDSRNLLAASRNIRNDVFYYIQKFNGLHNLSVDIRLPRKLLSLLGLKLVIMKCNEYDKNFDKYLRRNVYMIQSEKKKVLYYNFFKYQQGKVNVSGNFTGIFRPFDWQIFQPPNSHLNDISCGVLFKKYKYVTNYIDNWESNYKQYLLKYKYPITDIFYWENTGANWVPMFQTELDIAIEEWCPFNCHEILSEILSIEQKNREYLQQQLSHEMWPETLYMPLQPPDIFSVGHINNKLKNILYLILIKLRIFPIFKYAYRKLVEK